MKRPHGLLLCAFTLLLVGCGGDGGGGFVPPRVLSVTVTPANPRVGVNGTQQFTANVTVEGSTSTAVSWSITPAVTGSINAITGLYTAPASVPAPVTVTVTATSVADRTKSASATATITINVVITPATPQILIGTSQSFTAFVQGAANQVDHWTVNGITDGDAATVGAITRGNPATYTAPCTPPSSGSITIGAVPVADPTVTGSTTAFVKTPAQLFVVIPPSTLVAPGGTATFTANAANTPGSCGGPGGSGPVAANWSVAGGGTLAPGCTGTTTCDFTAPTSVPFNNAITIRAADPADASRFGTATATIDGPITITAIRPRSRISGLSNAIEVTVNGNNVDFTAKLFPPQSPPCSGTPLDGSFVFSGNPPGAMGTLPSSDQSNPGTLVLSICNISNGESARVPFVLVDTLPAGSTGTPVAVAVPDSATVTGADVVAVDDAAVGDPNALPLNQVVLGIALVAQGTCPLNSLVGGPVTIIRPTNGIAQFILCAGGDNLSGVSQATFAQYTVSLTGPTPPDILVFNPPTERPVGSGGLQTTLTVPSDAKPGPRSLVIRDLRSNLAVAAGGVIIK